MSGAPTGVNRRLEAKADQLLADDRRGITAVSEKNFYLNPEQLDLRHDHEVLHPSPDAAYLRGLYSRVYNPFLGRRPTTRRRFAHDLDPWEQDAWESFGGFGNAPAIRYPDNRPTYTYERKFKMKTIETVELPEQDSPNGLVSHTPEEPSPEPPEETWRSIPIEGLQHYQVSDQGNIRNSKGELLTPYRPGKRAGGDKDAVPWITLHTKAYRMDKLVLETFIGPPQSWRYGPRHRNGKQADCRLENLEWEYGLGRKPQAQASPKRATRRTTTTYKPPAPRPPISEEVQERVFLEAGNITLMWNRTDRKVDLSQLPDSSPMVSEADVPSLVKCLQHIMDARSLNS